MTKIVKLTHLIEQEKLLYLEVEQLRFTLYLHDESFLFQFFSVFYFTFNDIFSYFLRKKKRSLSVIEEKERAVHALQMRKSRFQLLQKTPYAWIIFSIRNLAKVLSFRTSDSEVRNPASATEHDSGKKTCIIFGSAESGDLQVRSVQIARKLAEKYTTIYIEGVFDEGKRAGYRIVEKSSQFTAIRLTAFKSFHLNYQKPSPKEILLLKQSLRLFIKDFKNIKIYIHHPFWSLILPLKKKSFYLDRASDFTHEHTAAKHIEESEKKLMKNALIVSAPHIKLLRNKKDIVLKNGVDWEMFKDTSKMIQTCDVGLCWIKKPVIGYIGTLDERVDEVLLGSIATAFPTASIVLVGNTDYRPVIEVAEKFQNIFPVGKQAYKKLPLFLQSFDILITPFKYNKNTTMGHPEFPLYLSSGKPIVTTPTTAAVVNGLMYKAKTHVDWMIAIAEALKEGPRSKKKFLRIAFARKLIWESPKFG